MDQPAPTIVSDDKILGKTNPSNNHKGLKQKKSKEKVHKKSSEDVVKEIININRQAGQHFHKLDKVAKGIVRKLGWGGGLPLPDFFGPFLTK